MKTKERKTKTNDPINPLLLFIKRLKELGHTEEEAETIADYVEQRKEIDISHLATKDQVIRIEEKFDERFIRIEEKFDERSKSVDERFVRIEEKLDEKASKTDLLQMEIRIKDEISKNLKWMVGITIAVVGSLWFK